MKILKKNDDSRVAGAGLQAISLEISPTGFLMFICCVLSIMFSK